MSKLLQQAIDPSKNIAVFASAGTGKTHLLIHRILKLLLSDVNPSNILAITFTRKAAAEMQERLMKVLEHWAGSDDQELNSALQDLYHSNDKLCISKARNLYERILFSDFDIRITTFHAFCQDILKRFAIHANVPAGFHLIETTDRLKQEARESLYKKAQSDNDGDAKNKLSNCIYLLLHHCTTVNNLNSVLDTFIDSQNDWRSFVEGQSNAVDYASKCLYRSLFGEQKIIEVNKFYIDLSNDLQQYQSYLLLHQIDTYKNNYKLLSTFLNIDSYSDDHIEIIYPVFFTKEQSPKYIKPNKTLEKKLGTEKLDQFIKLNEKLINLISEKLDLIKKKNLFQFNQAWFQAGEQLLAEYQQLKFSRHVLDFDDLEWHTYELLNKYENAAWIQYKLDQRIEHILIDEFQDTNPTQWNLLLPLLEELAASLDESNNKSLFFVGDAKQSIYGFRRANPQLQIAASNWAQLKLNAKLLETDSSYRSSPIIINFVNNIFDNQDETILRNYSSHKAVNLDIWGHVEISPLITTKITKQDESENKPVNVFRDPLREVREKNVFDSHYEEGRIVAKQIKFLITEPAAIYTSKGARPARLSDIIILTRSRNHLASFELALREHDINYKSVSEGDFLEQLEVQDMLALLTYLIQPHNDLALAQTLRSPCFAVSDEDLMLLSSLMPTDTNSARKTSWSEKLNCYSNSHPKSLLAEANLKLQEFGNIANKIPVHDLLDYIYFNLNIYKRYTSSCPSNKRPQVIANLTHLLQLTLDVDAGRYSSIQSFLESMQNTKINNPHAGACTEEVPAQQENVVQIMTVHAAKGLEAPIIFLVDTATAPKQQRAYNTVIDWPSDSAKPKQFFIHGRKKDIDLNTQTKLDAHALKNWGEELNLLYVALTRAKQYLYISGVETKKDQAKTWFSVINAALKKLNKNIEDGPIVFHSDNHPKVKDSYTPSTVTEYKTDINLGKPFESSASPINQAIEEDPSSSEQTDYGTLVHKIFELANMQNPLPTETLQLLVENSISRNISTDEFNSAYQEVKNCFQATELNVLFDNTNEHEILNEVPICFNQNNKAVTRIIDRLIIMNEEAWIIDFKTTQQVSLENMAQQAAHYRQQISEYIYAVRKLYPDKRVRASILFTAIASLYDYQVEEYI